MCEETCACRVDQDQSPRCACGLYRIGESCPYCGAATSTWRIASVEQKEDRLADKAQAVADYDARVAEGSSFDVGARLAEIKASLASAGNAKKPVSPAQAAARKQFAARQRAEKREQKRREKKYQEIDQLPEEILHPVLRDDRDELPFDD